VCGCLVKGDVQSNGSMYEDYGWIYFVVTIMGMVSYALYSTHFKSCTNFPSSLPIERRSSTRLQKYPP